MITFTIETTAKGQFAVYEKLSDGRRWNCRAVCDTEGEAEALAARFATAEARIAALPREVVPPGTPYCWECGLPIKPGEGVPDALGMAHRSCVGG